MHSEIVNRALDKTKEIIKKREGVEISTTKASEDLSIILKDEYSVEFSDKSLREVAKGKTSVKKREVLNGICKFLGYKNYEDYNGSTTRSEPPSPTFEWIKKFKIQIIVSILVTIFLFSLFALNKQRWMIWNNDHYIEVRFDTEKYELGQLKLHKEERIKYFRKIEATCDVEYFDKKGKPKTWYGKNAKGELEVFTSLGLHPETGKTLKPITKYMIKKYFCKEYH